MGRAFDRHANIGNRIGDPAKLGLCAPDRAIRSCRVAGRKREQHRGDDLRAVLVGPIGARHHHFGHGVDQQRQHVDVWHAVGRAHGTAGRSDRVYCRRDCCDVVVRRCGTCTLCCKLLAIPALDKPSGEWCRHCAPGLGCKIYPKRPSVCQIFACQWLRDESFGDAWFPPKAKMFAYLDASAQPRLFRVVASVPGRWRQSPYRERLRVVSNLGLRRGDFDTVAQYREQFWLILPDSEVEITGKTYVVRETALGWEVKTFITAQEAEAYRAYHQSR